MQLCLQCSCGRGLHRSSGLQKAQAIRMTSQWITSKAKCKTVQIAHETGFEDGEPRTASRYSPTSQSSASSRVLNVGNSRCEKLLKFSMKT